VRLGINPIGLTVSRDGQWLYVTAQNRDERAEQGTLSVLSVPRAETDPAASIVARALAGCDPGLVITTSGGATVWVTARESNALLAFSAARLHTDPGRALIARVQVGQRPIGLTALHGGDRILVANSDMHPRKGTMASLGVVDAPAPWPGGPPCSG
jgi:DNA-binding beta-propeller fold protein YncE